MLNYLARLDDRVELLQIAKEATARARRLDEQERERRLRQRFEQLAAAAVIVRDPEVHVISLGGRDPLASRPRWFVRKVHRGRKHLGLFVTADRDVPLRRGSAVWLSWDDAAAWVPGSDEVAEAVG